jgi:O-antigen/teichoic acid export membrane protein
MKKLLKSEIVKNTGILVTGTVLAQLIPMILQVVLRRMYPAEVFGVFSVYFTLMSLGVFFFTFRYELSIVNPSDDRDAMNLVGVVMSLSLISLVILTVLLFFFYEPISKVLNIPNEYSYWLFFLPVSLFFYSSYLGMQYWLIRKKNFKGISLNKIVRRSVEGVFQIIWGALKLFYGLVAGLVLGVISIFFMGFVQSKKAGFSLKEVSWQRMKKVAHEYKEYPLYNTLPAFLNTAGLMLPILFINKFFGTDITGQFDLTRQILAVPAALLSVSLSQVYLQRLSEKFNSKQSIKKDLFGLLAFLSIISVVAFIIIFFWGIPLFTFFFGKEWYLAGEFARLLIFKYLLVFVVSPVSIVLIAIKKIKTTSAWQVLYFLAILLLWFFKDMEIFSFLRAYVFIDIVLYSIYFFLIAYNVIRYERTLK